MKEHLLSTKQPTIEDNNIIVNAPSTYSLTINISGILPNTLNMKNAIQNNIENLINNLDIGENLKYTVLFNTIKSTIDENDNELEDFILNNPITDVNISNNQVIIPIFIFS